MLPDKMGKNFLKFRIAWDANIGAKVRKEVTYLVPKDLPQNMIRIIFNRKKIGNVIFFFLKNR